MFWCITPECPINWCTNKKHNLAGFIVYGTIFPLALFLLYHKLKKRAEKLVAKTSTNTSTKTS